MRRAQPFATSRQSAIQPNPWHQPSTVFSSGSMSPIHTTSSDVNSASSKYENARTRAVVRLTPTAPHASCRRARNAPTDRHRNEQRDRDLRLRRAEVVEAPAERDPGERARQRADRRARGHRAHLQAGEARPVVHEVVRDRRREPHVEDGPEAALLDEAVEALDALGQQVRSRVAREVARDRHLHHGAEHDERERDRRPGRRAEQQPGRAREHRAWDEEAQGARGRRDEDEPGPPSRGRRPSRAPRSALGSEPLTSRSDEQAQHERGEDGEPQPGRVPRPEGTWRGRL